MLQQFTGAYHLLPINENSANQNSLSVGVCVERETGFLSSAKPVLVSREATLSHSFHSTQEAKHEHPTRRELPNSMLRSRLVFTPMSQGRPYGFTSSSRASLQYLVRFHSISRGPTPSLEILQGHIGQSCALLCSTARHFSDTVCMEVLN